MNTGLDPVARSRRPLLAIRIGPVREESLQELIATRPDEVQQVLHEEVLVLVSHPRNVVHHITGIVLDQELRAASLEVGITGERSCALYEAVIRGGGVRMGGSAGVVERSEDTRRAAFLDEVAHNLVVEVLDWCPFDLLPDVLLLLGLQRELNEDLLQLLVDVIDAQLLERVILSITFRM